MTKVRIKEIVSYNGHSLSASGSVNLSLKAMYGELRNTILAMQLLNEDVTIKVKLDGKVRNAGVFRIKSIVIDGDGESKLKFEGLTDSIDLDVLNNMPLRGEDSAEFQMLMEAQVEDAENPTEEE